MKGLSTFVVTVVLIVGLVGCAPASTATLYDLTIVEAPGSSGIATDLTNSSPYAAGTSVNIKATANSGYQFANWTAPAGTFTSVNAEQTTFTMSAQNVTVTANLVPGYKLAIVANPVGGGTATDLTNGLPYEAGAVLNITAVAGAAYHFVDWTAPAGTLANVNMAQTTFTMPAQNAIVTANFAQYTAISVFLIL
jgi:uncharacterized repeat protein (TIGR02543 family)